VTGFGRVFGDAAVNYHRHRNVLPDDAVNWLVPNRCHRVLELGAGTGRFTRQLVDHVPASTQVYALDPDPAMLAQLAVHCPSVALLPAQAEAVPLRSDTVDAVLAVACWHWCDPQAALAEVARVLTPQGALAVGWHGRPTSPVWPGEVDDIVRSAHEPGREPGVFSLPDDSAFLPPERAEFPYTQPMTVTEILHLLGSYSGVLALSSERQTVMRKAQTYLTTQFGTQQTVEVRFTATCYRTRLRP
jgi:SAM-dependent methyltransferase